MKPVIALSLALVVGLAGAGSAFADQPVESSPPGATVIDWPGDEANHESYWETYFGNGYDCTKVNESGDFTTDVAHDAIVVKAGNYNFIWQPAAAATYSTSPEVSHWYYCDGPVEDDIIDPAGSIGGPCADPAYYGVFDNTNSTVPLWFRFRWYTRKGLHTASKQVPAGAIFRTWEHWVRPFTTIRVGYFDPNLNKWVALASQESVKGVYPECEYQRGYELPN